MRTSSTRAFSKLVLALGLASAAVPTALGDQILETYNSSLTSYLPAATGAQDLEPMARQRGVGLDGALRSPSVFGWSLAGNPFESAGGRLSGLWLDTGTYGITDVDIALPADVPWVIGRSYNKEGDWDGSTLTGTTRDENWTLDQLGNWDLFKRDLDGDLNYNETNELNDDRTHTIANELSARDTDDNGTDNYTLAFDGGAAGPGNQTDDGKEYTYKYDGWNRLKEVHNRSGGALVEEYTYNGLGYRTGMHYDTDADSDVDSSDKWYFFIYDTGWRLVATYRESSGTLDSSPKEQFVYNQAGLDGSGGSSYIDSVVYRTFDDTNGWTGAADGTMEQTHYPCQNWRGDVAVMLKPASGAGVYANVVFRAKYLSYGDVWSTRAGDTDCDGDFDGTDSTAITSGGYTVLKDVELDNDHDAADVTAAGAAGTLGWRTLGDSSLRWRKGYAGYERDPVLAGTKYHVRYRVLDAELGRWLQVDAVKIGDHNFYAYVHGQPTRLVDSLGLCGSVATQAMASGLDPGSSFPICSPPDNPIDPLLPIGPQLRPPPIITHPLPTFMHVCCHAVVEVPLVRHCELRNQCAPGDDQFEVWPDDSPGARTLDDGTPCSQATAKQIEECLARHSKDITTPLRCYPYGIDNNCQTAVMIELGMCCLKSTWKPNWYAGPMKICLEGHYESSGNAGTGSGGANWVCDKWLIIPDWWAPSPPSVLPDPMPQVPAQRRGTCP